MPQVSSTANQTTASECARTRASGHVRKGTKGAKIEGKRRVDAALSRLASLEKDLERADAEDSPMQRTHKTRFVAFDFFNCALTVAATVPGKQSSSSESSAEQPRQHWRRLWRNWRKLKQPTKNPRMAPLLTRGTTGCHRPHSDELDFIAMCAGTGKLSLSR
jgi:hypothetical protein